jgi:hypothetical protein
VEEVMKNDAQKNILLLTLAGLILIMGNAAILMGCRNGQIAPVDNLALWGAFAVLSVCSLLWAVSLLGLQPMVVAFSYTAGGIMAFQGVRLIPDVNVAEIAAAGATYSAFGALVIGNATARVRLAFFTKRQAPLVFIIIALLLVDSLLSSRVSSAGWNVIANAVVFPFLFAGVVVGLVWVLLARICAGRDLTNKTVAAVEPVRKEEPAANTAEEEEEVTQLVFTVPESAALAESMEGSVLVRDPEPVLEDNISKAPEPEPEVASSRMDSVEDEDAFPDNFFPLDIDKGEEVLPLEENPNLMGVAAMVAESAPVPAVEADPAEEADPVVEDSTSLAEESSVLASAPESAPELAPAPEPDLEKGKAGSSDWLNGHLDLLNKLN